MCTDGEDEHYQWQDRWGEPMTNDRKEPEQLWDTLDSSVGTKARDTHENRVRNPVGYHEPTGEAVIQPNHTGTERQAHNRTRAILKPEPEPSSISSTSKLHQKWITRLAVAHANESVERANHNRFPGVESDDVWIIYFSVKKKSAICTPERLEGLTLVLDQRLGRTDRLLNTNAWRLCW